VRVVGQVRTSNNDFKEAFIKEVIVYYYGDIGTQSSSSGNLSSQGRLAATKLENSILSSTEIYPNPAQNVVMIVTQDAKAQILISSMNDVVVKKVQASGSSTLIDISALSAGVYIVTVQDSNQRRERKRLIVDK
jgi:hypothetical protein